MAGGFATRLRPLSCSKPKLLFPIVGVPLLDRLLAWLRPSKVSTLILAVNHMSDRLSLEIGDKRGPTRIIYSLEPYPLGTGGPIRLARPMLESDPFIVVNGDIVSDIDLQGLVSFHEKSDVEATIALVRVPNPKPYGAAMVDSDGLITRFVEKSAGLKGPAWINAGVYVLNPKIVGRIKPGRFVSLEREVFPVIASLGKLQGWKHQGFWYDIGTTDDYVRANMRLLENAKFTHHNRSHNFVKEPSFIGKNCVLSSPIELGPKVILSDQVHVGKGSVLKRSIVFEKTRIGARCKMTGCIIGENVIIGDDTRIGEGTVISGQIKIPGNSVIRAGSFILN